MVNSEKVSKNMSEFSEHIIERLDNRISELKKLSIAEEFDKKLSKKILERL